MSPRRRRWIVAAALAVAVLVAWWSRYEVIECRSITNRCLMLDRWTGDLVSKRAVAR